VLRAATAVAVVVALGACAGGESMTAATDSSVGSDATSSGAASTTAAAEPEPLTLNDLWVQMEAAADPLADHRPDPVDCGIAGIFLEGEELDIDTNFCNYAMIEQPGLVEVKEGATITLSMRHFDLTAAEPATAHVALLLGETIAWERTLVIPGPAEVITVDFDAPVDHPLGAPVRFHLHNHGQNSWTLSSIMVTP
jgi:hypothetical protein